MKKIVAVGILGLFVFAISSCNNHEICYMNSADYSKNKIEHNQKFETLQEMSEANK